MKYSTSVGLEVVILAVDGGVPALPSLSFPGVSAGPDVACLLVGQFAGVSVWPVVVGRLVGRDWMAIDSVPLEVEGREVPGWSQRLARRCVAGGGEVSGRSGGRGVPIAGVSPRRAFSCSHRYSAWTSPHRGQSRSVVPSLPQL